MPIRYLYDLESDGFLDSMTRIHVLVLYNMDTKDTLVFRHNDTENTIEQGVRLLEVADLRAGHNIIGFDEHAIRKVFPDYNPIGKVIDTLVLSRVTAPDIKVFDYRLFNSGKMASNMIGSHSLKAWGIRLGKSKGDYSDDMKAQGLDPWASWNQAMEDYCVQDVEVTKELWNRAIQKKIDPRCVELEHDIHELCVEMEQNGFPFDIAAAENLASQLEQLIDPLTEKAVAEFGARHFVPKKKRVVKPQFYDPEGIQLRKEKKGEFYKPNAEWGEDMSRSWWGEVTVPKVNYSRDGVKYVKDAPHCKAEWVDFNPTSRQQIVDKLITDHNWVPNDFTDTGMPSIDDGVLRKLAGHIPVCSALADLFFVKKIYGQLKSGNKSWINCYNKDTGKIHARTNAGGTVTGRAAHSNPNIGQVPSVLLGPVFLKDGSPNPALLLPNGDWHPLAYDKRGALHTKEAPLPGFAGEYGWECRSLFHVPEEWVQVGIDLSGIEFRCLAERIAEFDGGTMIDIIVSGQDIHRYNMTMTGITDRGMIKRVLYALLYGAGDLKLGLTANPRLSLTEALQYGREVRALLMDKLPALNSVINKIKKEAQKGYLIGLDGRHLKVRSEHSALNTDLQSAAGLIAKKWLVTTRKNAIDHGMRLGWKMQDGSLGDFVMLAFVHDEQQNAVAPELAAGFAKIAIDAAAETGKYFGFKCPISAEAKIGRNWAECH